MSQPLTAAATSVGATRALDLGTIEGAEEEQRQQGLQGIAGERRPLLGRIGDHAGLGRQLQIDQVEIGKFERRAGLLHGEGRGLLLKIEAR